MLKNKINNLVKKVKKIKDEIELALIAMIPTTKAEQKMLKGKAFAYTVATQIVLSPHFIFAAGNDGGWGELWSYVAEWVPKLGGGIAALGAIEFIIAFQTEDPQLKVKGMRTVATGAMLFGAAKLITAMTAGGGAGE